MPKWSSLCCSLSFLLICVIANANCQEKNGEFKHELPEGVELVDPKSLGLTDVDLSKFLGNVKVLGGGQLGDTKTQILTVGFDGDESINFNDFVIPGLTDGNKTSLPEKDKQIADMAFQKFKEFFQDPKKGKQFDEQNNPNNINLPHAPQKNHEDHHKHRFNIPPGNAPNHHHNPQQHPQRPHFHIPMIHKPYVTPRPQFLQTTHHPPQHLHLTPPPPPPPPQPHRQQMFPPFVPNLHMPHLQQSQHPHPLNPQINTQSTNLEFGARIPLPPRTHSPPQQPFQQHHPQQQQQQQQQHFPQPQHPGRFQFPKQEEGLRLAVPPPPPPAHHQQLQIPQRHPQRPPQFQQPTNQPTQQTQQSHPPRQQQQSRFAPQQIEQNIKNLLQPPPEYAIQQQQQHQPPSPPPQLNQQQTQPIRPSPQHHHQPSSLPIPQPSHQPSESHSITSRPVHQQSLPETLAQSLKQPPPRGEPQGRIVRNQLLNFNIENSNTQSASNQIQIHHPPSAAATATSHVFIQHGPKTLLNNVHHIPFHPQFQPPTRFAKDFTPIPMQATTTSRPKPFDVTPSMPLIPLSTNENAITDPTRMRQLRFYQQQMIEAKAKAQSQAEASNSPQVQSVLPTDEPIPPTTTPISITTSFPQLVENQNFMSASYESINNDIKQQHQQQHQQQQRPFASANKIVDSDMKELKEIGNYNLNKPPFNLQVQPIQLNQLQLLPTQRPTIFYTQELRRPPRQGQPPPRFQFHLSHDIGQPPRFHMSPSPTNLFNTIRRKRGYRRLSNLFNKMFRRDRH